MGGMMQTYLLGTERFEPAGGIPLTDRGFRYGMSVFETIAIRDGVPLLLDAHLTKLAGSSAGANFRPPLHWPDASSTLLNQPPITEGVARLYITAGDDWQSGSRVAAIFEAMPIPTTLSKTKAIAVDFTPALPFGKTGNYWPHFAARPEDGSDAILCRPDGRLLGGSMSNLFLILDGVLVTPRLFIRRGVVGDWIAFLGEGLDHGDLTREDLTRATSAFLTNSRMGLCALTSIDGRELEIHPLVESIWASYRREVLRAG
jgi:branched-subunit amino acid aminotransferase/4-amino-4-deoxychorismate lyase